MLKFVYILNFELILDILEHSKPSMFSLKQPARLAACYLENVPLMLLFWISGMRTANRVEFLTLGYARDIFFCNHSMCKNDFFVNGAVFFFYPESIYTHIYWYKTRTLFTPMSIIFPFLFIFLKNTDSFSFKIYLQNNYTKHIVRDRHCAHSIGEYKLWYEGHINEFSVIMFKCLLNNI